MNGSGMPVIGMMPIVMPMFSNIWNASIASTPTHTSTPKKSRASRAVRHVRHITIANSAEQHDRADEAELLPHRREDEVGVLLGHEAALGLRAVLETLAGEPPVGDGLLRLLLVVRGALRWCRSRGRGTW